MPDPETPDPSLDLSGRAPPRLSIVVVSYNTREMTLDCLASVAAETRTPHEVIVIDNASTDGSAAAIAERFPGAVLMAETVNHGFARANNIAATRARGDYLLLLNPDTVILDGAIDRLMDFAAARPGAKIWGGRTLYGDRSLNPTNCWRQMTLWSLVCQLTGLARSFPASARFNPEAYGGWARDSEREVEIVTGCFLLTTRAFWDTLGGFDLTFVMYGEEADLCRRAARMGARPRITPEAQIIHYVGASADLRAGKQVMVARAKITLIDRYFPGWRRPVARALFAAWPLSRALGAGVLARLTGRPRHRALAASWGEVWRRRGEWLAGYAPGGDPAGIAPSAPAAAPQPASLISRRNASPAARAFRAATTLLDPRILVQPFRLLHYYNYTHVAPRRKLTLGARVRLAPNVSFANAERIAIGDGTQIGARCHLWAGDAAGRITIGAGTTFGPDCFLTASDYGIAAGMPIAAQPRRERDITVGADVWLGAKVIVTAGVTIGDGCVVGAGAVVTRDLPPGSIAVGVPAKVVGHRT